MNEKRAKAIATGQFILMHLFFVIAVLSYLFFFTPSAIFPVITGIGYIAFVYSWKTLTGPVERIVISTLISVFAFGIVMSTYFYPNLLQYQSYSEAAIAIREADRSDQLYYLNCYRHYQHSLDFYSRKVLPEISENEITALPEGSLVIVPHDCKDLDLQDKGLSEYKRFPHFRIATLNMKFLLKDKRADALKQTVIYERN